MGKQIVFIDLEVSRNGDVLDFGAVNENKEVFHSISANGFAEFVSQYHFICGHNIIEHDLKYCGDIIKSRDNCSVIDTLYLSPLLFPNKPYHRLVKDDKLQTDQVNNPANDALKSMELFYDELNAYNALSPAMKYIYCSLLKKGGHFRGFFDYIGIKTSFFSVESEIRKKFECMICANADISYLVKRFPVELAYALAVISANDRYSVTPPWVYYNYPLIEKVIRMLRSVPCRKGCRYCTENLNIRKKLKDIFGFDSFRTYDGEPLQEKAAEAAVQDRSLLAIFPTGGGKSLTFQLPALMAGGGFTGSYCRYFPTSVTYEGPGRQSRRKGHSRSSYNKRYAQPR